MSPRSSPADAYTHATSFPCSSQTPVRVKHWFTLSIFFSVWDEDLRGQPLNRKQHGHLREGKLRLKTAITHVSLSPQSHPGNTL